MTGIDDPNEPPEKPEIHLQGEGFSAQELADQVVAVLLEVAGRIAG